MNLSLRARRGEDNHLNTEQIRFGLSNLRNPAFASHTFHILPCQGIGSGILRALEDWPRIEFIDDRRGNQFRVTLKRPDAQAEVRSEKILAALRHNPQSTIAELAKIAGVTTRSIERSLNKLQQENPIARIGHDRGGPRKVLVSK